MIVEKNTDALLRIFFFNVEWLQVVFISRPVQLNVKNWKKAEHSLFSLRKI